MAKLFSAATRRFAAQAHRSVGGALALIFYTLFLTGTISQFEDDLVRFEHAAYRSLPITPVPSYDALLERLLDEADAPGDSITIIPASPSRPYVEMRGDLAGVEGAYNGSRVRYITSSGSPLPYHGYAAVRFVRSLHGDLLIEPPVGRVVLGMLGSVFLALIATGLVQGPNIAASLKLLSGKLRGRSRIAFRHRRAGYAASPYAIVLAISGMVLGFSAIPSCAPADQQTAAKRSITAPSQVPLGLDDAISEVRSAHPGGDLRLITIEGLEDGSPHAVLVMRASQDWMIDRFFTYALAPAERLSSKSAADTLPGFVVAFMMPLHYGSYLGWWSKALHVLVGCLLVAVAVHAIRLWVRTPASGNAGRHFRRLALNYVWAFPLGIIASLAVGQFWKPEGDQIYAFATVALAVTLSALAVGYLARRA